jgi:hypothetical protein
VSEHKLENMTATLNLMQNELNLYKSVIVPIAHKPQTKVTRLNRPLGTTSVDIVLFGRDITNLE